jgi:FHA domain
MEATQESTQPYSDPRRIGSNNSGLSEQDAADIICILHPNSRAAHDAVASTARMAPQNILQRDELEYEDSNTSAWDIALRLSSTVRDIGMGFCFGRNRMLCDVCLSPDDTARGVSSVHFRIYLTPDCILMLQDTSTNGTVVDNCRLQKGSKDTSRMLTNGSLINVVACAALANEIRFVVRTPSRDGCNVAFNNNVIQYFQRVQMQAPINNAHPLARPPTQVALPWAVSNPYGMHWSGGSVYNVTGQIGKGGFATVYKLATKQHGVVYAAKELDKRRFVKNGILDQKVDNEMKIMRGLRHVRRSIFLPIITVSNLGLFFFSLI